MFDFRPDPADVQAVLKRCDELIEVLRKIEARAAHLSERLVDGSALSSRLNELEATVERRLAGATAELIEARDEYRKARNAEQRARDQVASAASSPEISEEDLEELTAEIRRELQREYGAGSEGGGVQPVRTRVAYDDEGPDEADLW